MPGVCVIPYVNTNSLILIRVRLGTNGDAASDRFASAAETAWNDTMWREIRVARPVE